MADNVFNEKKEYLLKAQEEVKKRDELSREIETLKASYKKLSKTVAYEEKSIEDEIYQTVRKRKQEMEVSFDKRIDENRSRRKKVSNKRDKKKNERMNKRIEGETKHIRKDNHDLILELKTLFKKEKVPGYCKTHLYYIMFSPRGVGEILSMLLAFFVFFAGIPSVLTLLIRKFLLAGRVDDNMAFWCVLIVAVIIILQLIIYFVIYNSTKLAYRDTIEQGRNIWDKIKANKRQVEVIKNSISKDKDESQYKLGAFDKQMEELDEELETLGQEKLKSLKDFDENTTEVITDEIKGRRLAKVNELKEEMKNVEEKISKAESMYSDQAMLVSKEYAIYLGEDLCTYDKIGAIIKVMEEGNIDTVSSAIAAYKEKK